MKRKSKKFKFKYSFLIAILVIAIFCFETVGYASFSRILTFNGTSSFKKVGTLHIVSIENTYMQNCTENNRPTYTGLDVDFDVSFSNLNSSNSGKVVYDVTIINEDYKDYTYTGWNFDNYRLTSSNGGTGEFTPTITGISPGDVIESDDQITVTVTFDVTSNGGTGFIGIGASSYNYTLGVSSEVESTSNPVGDIYGTFTSSTEGDLRNNNMVPFTISVMNTFEFNQTFNLSTKSSKIELVDNRGRALTDFNINANSTTEYTFYVRLKNNVTLSSDVLNTIISLNYGTKTRNINSISLLVNATVEEQDTDPPTVSNLSATKNDTDGSLTLIWNGNDDSDVNKYYILVYSVNNNNETLLHTYNTSGDETNYTINNLTPGNYSFKVYGEDASDNRNKPTQIEIDNANNNHCVKLNSQYYQWYVSVSQSLDQCSSNFSSNKTKYGEDLVINFTANANRTLNNPTVKIGNTTATANNQYTYSNGTLTIKGQYITDDITITETTSGACLIEGTKILLGNNKYKNIEDITYSDLLKVWNYDTGTYDYEYPIWIEKESSTSHYQLNTFSDGSVLKTYGYHGVFNKDLNRFVSVDNKSEFYIGANIIKVENNKLKTVKVTKIEYKKEIVNYYHVVSSRYYNIIANDFLTTDGTVILSNLYGFDNNLKWLNKNNNKYSYNDFKDIVPFYMFKGMRMEEAYNLKEYGLDLNSFKYYLKLNQLNDNLLLKPKSKNNKYIFYVSTNTGIKSEIIESSYFRLPNTYKYWKNSIDNKIYNSNELVRIDCSTHFIGYN